MDWIRQSLKARISIPDRPLRNTGVGGIHERVHVNSESGFTASAACRAASAAPGFGGRVSTARAPPA